MKKEMLEALEHISTHTVQLGHMLERMSAQIEAHEARLAQMLIDHEERMGKALQAILDTAARPTRPPSEAEALTSLVTDPGETS
jgi:hypothetical protein